MNKREIKMFLRDPKTKKALLCLKLIIMIIILNIIYLIIK